MEHNKNIFLVCGYISANGYFGPSQQEDFDPSFYQPAVMQIEKKLGEIWYSVAVADTENQEDDKLILEDSLEQTFPFIGCKFVEKIERFTGQPAEVIDYEDYKSSKENWMALNKGLKTIQFGKKVPITEEV
jgi:hypothetical protein